MKIEAVVALCKCGKTQQTYGVRFERTATNSWKYTWAFEISLKVAKREGYNIVDISGYIEPAEEYPGCPYCGNKYFMICDCGKLNCNIINSNATATCNWCGFTGMISGYDGSGFVAGGDL